MIFDEWNNALVVWTIGVMKVSLVDQHHSLRRRFGDELAQLITRRDAGSRVVRITDVYQTGTACCHHFGQIMTILGSKWNLYYFSAICGGVVQNSFESRIGSDELTTSCQSVVRRASKDFGAKFQNFTGTIAQQYLIRSDVIEFSQ